MRMRGNSDLFSSATGTASGSSHRIDQPESNRLELLSEVEGSSSHINLPHLPMEETHHIIPDDINMDSIEEEIELPSGQDSGSD